MTAPCDEEDPDYYPAEAPTGIASVMSDRELREAIEQQEIWVARAPLRSAAYASHLARLRHLYSIKELRTPRVEVRGFDPTLRR